MRSTPGIPRAVPIPVPSVRTLLRSLTQPSPALHRGLSRHQRLRERLQHRPRQICVAVITLEVLAKPPRGVESRRDSHRDPPQIGCVRTAP